MSFQIRCRGCGRAFRFSAEFSGRTVACKDCGAAIRVPVSGRSQRGRDTRAARPRRSRDYDDRSARSGGNTVLWATIGGIVAGVALVVGLAIFAVMQTADKGGGESEDLFTKAGRESEGGHSGDNDNGGRDAGDPGFDAGQNRAAAQPKLWAKGDVTFRVPTPRGRSSRVTFSAPRGAFAEIDNIVYDLKTGQRLGSFSAPFERWTDKHHALNADGTRLALIKTGKDVPNTVYVYRRDDEQPVRFEVEGGYRNRPGPIRFLDRDRLLSSWRSGRGMKMILWNVATKTVLSEYQLPASLDAAGSAVAPSGDALAAGDDESLNIYRPHGGTMWINGFPAPRGGGNFPFSTMGGLAFSPDMKELAGVTGGGVFAVWSVRTRKIVFNQRVPGVRFGFYGREQIQWLPDGSGWLLNGKYLLDRKSGRVAWSVTPDSFYDDAPSKLIDRDTVALLRGDSNGAGEMIAMKIPWNKINAALEGVDTRSKLLEAGGKVRIEVNVANVRFSSVAQVRQILGTALVTTLKKDNVTVDLDSDVVLRIDYNETAGASKRVVDVFRSDTGRRIQETKGAGKIGLYARGEGKPRWADSFNYDAGLIINGELSDRGVRNEMFDSVKNYLKRLKIPLTLPKTKSGGKLPVVTDLH